MSQVLKEEIKNKILAAAEKKFYEKDYRSAKLTDIADEADIPVALIYTYFKDKEGLFDAVICGVHENFLEMLEFEEQLDEGLPSDKFEKLGEEYIHKLLGNHIKLVILMDKSSGTQHFNAKESWIARLELHIKKGSRQAAFPVDPMLFHILAANYVEGLLEIARHYKNDDWAHNMLMLMNRCYYKGVDSLQRQ